VQRVECPYWAISNQPLRPFQNLRADFNQFPPHLFCIQSSNEGIKLEASDVAGSPAASNRRHHFDGCKYGGNK
jgi:hypothetical protein